VNTVKTMTPAEQSLLRLQLIAAGGVDDVQLPAGASFLIRGADSVVTGYRSGKVLFQGRGSDALVALADGIVGDSGLREQGMVFPVVGGDESGKGDLFGPLVVAAFAARTASERAAVTRAGARDCKLMTDSEVRTVAPRLMDLGMSSVKVLMPAEYNARYAPVHNTNVLLNQIYSELLLGLATRCDAHTVILDKYGGRAASLWGKPPSFRFIVETHAERYPEVAAASVLARAAFLEGLERTAELSKSRRLPKGSSVETQAFMRRLAADRGEDILPFVVKMNFTPVKDYLNSLF
jgi:ribonuclease HIII